MINWPNGSTYYNRCIRENLDKNVFFPIGCSLITNDVPNNLYTSFECAVDVVVVVVDGIPLSHRK